MAQAANKARQERLKSAKIADEHSALRQIEFGLDMIGEAHQTPYRAAWVATRQPSKTQAEPRPLAARSRSISRTCRQSGNELHRIDANGHRANRHQLTPPRQHRSRQALPLRDSAMHRGRREHANLHASVSANVPHDYNAPRRCDDAPNPHQHNALPRQSTRRVPHSKRFRVGASDANNTPTRHAPRTRLASIEG
ncbi:hypothetical protein Rcae01_03950 [Novipirellula caenicola]|uniref:Uncharacterized protein n=1 Tax=Novipirellula caenicola TaxID=1536901 RepID=A0ABP9VTK1_9BACT